MSKYLQKFRTDWSISVSKQLGIKQNEAEAIFDKYCQDSELEIYNSVNFQTTKMFATDFYYISQINFILQENGVLFWKHSKKESVIGKEIGISSTKTYAHFNFHIAAEDFTLV